MLSDKIWSIAFFRWETPVLVVRGKEMAESWRKLTSSVNVEDLGHIAERVPDTAERVPDTAEKVPERAEARATVENVEDRDLPKDRTDHFIALLLSV